jgi:hypothetical protein
VRCARLASPSSLWESGRALHPLDRGLLALHAADPEVCRNAADWPIGRRNRALARLRAACFGPALRGWTDCPLCREQLEFELDARSLSEDQRPERDEPILALGCAFRPPTSRDLAQVAAETDTRAAAIRLIERCGIGGTGASEEQTPRQWSDEDLNEVGEQMALADPLAEIMLHFDCPQCGASFDESLDLAAFVWAEVERHAKRLLLQVHELAAAYGWSETQILSLAPGRRDFYLTMVRA